MYMKRFICFAILGLAAFSMARTERNSFFDYHASTVPALMHQLETRPQVLARYERFFAKSGPEVMAYMKTLHVGKLEETQEFKVYSIPPTGYLKVHMQILKKGTPVFMDQYNQPMMLVVCGNPLQAPSLPTETMTNAQALAPTPVPANMPAPGSTTEMPPNAVALVPPVPEVPVVPTPTVTPASVPVPVARSSSEPWILIPLVAGAFVATSHHSCPPPKPVPEPASIISMIGAVGGLAFAKRRKK